VFLSFTEAALLFAPSQNLSASSFTTFLAQTPTHTNTLWYLWVIDQLPTHNTDKKETNQTDSLS
jgi:hypothetical protein